MLTSLFIKPRGITDAMKADLDQPTVNESDRLG
jgi:hypothetical protein